MRKGAKSDEELDCADRCVNIGCAWRDAGPTVTVLVGLNGTTLDCAACPAVEAWLTRVRLGIYEVMRGERYLPHENKFAPPTMGKVSLNKIAKRNQERVSRL